MNIKFNEQTPHFRLKSKQLPLKKGAVLKQNGFTLVELLIVISIMGILTVVGASSFKTVQLKSRDVRRKNDLNSISKALNMYYNDIGTFPHGTPDIGDMIKKEAEGVGFSASINGTVTTYMVEMPRETTNGVKDYGYSYITTGKSFKLFANLENVNDGSCLKNIDGTLVTNIDNYNIGNVGCIYGVSSSNIKIGDSLL